ncbi:PVC-type heme-binding CxxCH protein [Planctellipticum variicoloris]|uniref:PVC-type heme-binding CxxCH protein n=1 Tax=Planctellipticum variicoloris TaxID=3064265 RepID=UPI00301358BA|nr:PQQ-dependent sugar dehydrogenase [Planctomycetaceae bacterium SH412]
MPGLPLRFAAAVLALGLLNSCLHADEPYAPKIAEASNDGEVALQRFRLVEGMTGRLIAAEPQLANPVAFGIDEQGRIFVCETFRQSKGVEDNRSHMKWLLDDLAAQTVDDRVAFFRKHQGDRVAEYAKEHDRIRLLTDVDGDGQFEKSTVFAEGFNQIADGTGAGVLAWNGNVYYTCIPKLWLLQDSDGDGAADVRKPLYDGFGVRVAFRGHDMHGLVLGPDGRIYFSIGDRGFHVETPQGLFALPDQGAVFRCERDGSNLEVFATGLRNPQELAFDEFGNLFTGDNNSDGGDRARWVYVVQGGETGWRMYYQYLNDRGPWNREKLWHPAHAGQAAYIVPPIANFADGPSGLAHYPGVGLADRYRGHFFLADFRGSPANSGVRSFSLETKGASFEMDDAHEFIWSVLATDVDFGYDGGLYLSDWVDGWEGEGKGRMYRFRDEQHGNSDVVQQVGRLMREGFADRPVAELIGLLSHPDYRIRQRAQFELADRRALAELTANAIENSSLHARVHAIWGVGQIVRAEPARVEPLLALASDPQVEIRAQLARILTDAPWTGADRTIDLLLKDESQRIRSLAAIAARGFQSRDVFRSLITVLAENNDADPVLRHAASFGLAKAEDAEALAELAGHVTAPVRMGAVIALRRLQHPGLTAFLNDTDPLIVLEAARAIHDVPVAAGLPALAKLAGQPGLSDPLLRRVISANYQLGALENAQAVAGVAADASAPEPVRIEAVQELLDWNKPDPLGRVLGDYRPLPERSVDVAQAIRPVLGAIFAGPESLRELGAKLAGRYGIKDVEPFLIGIFRDVASPASGRVASLKALESLKSGDLLTVVDEGLTDQASVVRSEARRVLTGLDPERAIPELAKTMHEAPLAEQQSSISVLASLKRPEADKVLADWFDRMLAGKSPAGVQLDLLLAAEARQTPDLQTRSEAFSKRRKAADPLREYREALEGGDVERGREIFLSRSEVSCRRCHKIAGNGGEVGPDLSKIGLDKSREYLVEAIVDPSRQIAKGFETVVFAMDDGKVHTGIVKQEDADTVQLMNSMGETIKVNKKDIDERATGKSGMPEDLIKKISKADLRDLVEYLSTLKGQSDTAHGKGR